MANGAEEVEDVEEDETTYKFGELSPEAKERAVEEWREEDAGRQWDQYEIDEITEMFERDLEEAGLPHDKVYWSLGHVQGDGVSFEGKLDLDEYMEKNKLRRQFSSLFTPAYEPEEVEERLVVGETQEEQAGALAQSLDGLGLQARVRRGKGCFYVDVFDRGEEEVGKEEWLATFCVARRRGARENVSVESESEPGTGGWLLKRAGGAFVSKVGKTDYRIPIEEISVRVDSSHRYHSMTVEFSLNMDEDWLSDEQKRDAGALEDHIKDHVEDFASKLQKLGYDEIAYKTSDEVIADTLEANEYDFDEEGNRIR